MSGFFGYKLSEVAVLVILLVAIIPISKSAAAFNFLPIILGALAYLTLLTVRGVSLGLRILVSVLIAVIFVPRRFRGRRFYENFEDAAVPEPTVETPLVPPAAPPKGAEKSEEVKEEMEDVESEEAMENESEPAPSDIDALSAKFLGTKPQAKENSKTTKKYRLPSEKADGEHHMDAGSTFMKAYNQLKPEQVAALTTDTQKLISVQKDLMANLNNLKPLVSDGKEIMKTFKSFFGSDPTSS
ncbi:MAG: hypothetical protein EBY22_02730 [Gammaproteobacteria bacterium]|nr:hypothetical protein [Gammaproteobacteria bacterium]